MASKEPIDNPFVSRPSSLPLTGVNYNFITQGMKNRFLDSFESDLDDSDNPVYVFYGQSTNWGSNNSPSDISDTPTLPTNAFSDDISARINMTALARLDASNTNLGIKKRTWRSGTVYGQYTTTEDQSESPNDNYYVVQSVSNLPQYGSVYKCLDNNGGAPSTQAPYVDIEESIRPVTLDDGYKWKFMMRIPGSLISQFNTNQSPLQDFLPLWNSTDYKGSFGTIDRVDIINRGTNYYYSPQNSPNGSDIYGGIFSQTTVPLFVEGDGGSVEITKIRIAPDGTSNGRIVGFNTNAAEMITDPIGGYSILEKYPEYKNHIPVKFLEDVTTFTEEQLSSINNPNRKTAYGLAKITLRDGRGIIDSPGDIKIINGGDSYQNSTLVKVVQSSTVAYATSFDTPVGGIKRISVLEEGSGHSSANIIPVVNSPGGTGLNAIPVVSPLLGHGGDPQKELNATSLFITKSIIGNYDPGTDPSTLDFSRTNDFRQIGLIRKPKKYGSDEVATDSTLNAKHILSVVDNPQGELASKFEVGADKDLLITGNVSRAQGRIIDMFQVSNSSTWNVRYVKVGTRDFIANEKLLFANITTPISIAEALPPEVDVYSGDILFINNNEAITRDKQQTETVNLLITF